MSLNAARRASYEPLDFVVVRAPLLPVDAYCALGGSGDSRSISGMPEVRRALAVGSPALLTALEKSELPARKSARLESKLRRYLIRMSTRPTPYGLFAGVALARWGKTNLALEGPPHRMRTRPDMGWILGLIQKLESRPEVRQELSFFANPAIYVRDGRVRLSERSSLIDSDAPTAVSLRATAAVECLLKITQEPTPYRELMKRMEAEFPETDKSKIGEMISSLWRETVLLTNLRPCLTGDDVAKSMSAILRSIPSAAQEAEQIARWLEKMSAWDQMPAEGAVAAYRTLANEGATMLSFDGEIPLQVDMGLRLSGEQVNRAVGEEAALAAELLLRQTPRVYGDLVIAPYRQTFLARYGKGVEVSLLELLHPEFGLGPIKFDSGTAHPAFERNTTANLARDRFLFNLALTALRDDAGVVTLDDAAIKILQNPAVDGEAYPPSLDIFVSVAAASAAALDKGEFQIVIGPHVGSPGAGKSLGRFADMLGGDAVRALKGVAQREKDVVLDRIWAELVYLPRNSRSANVSIRPAVRSNEIIWGVQPGVPWSQTIPLEELVVGVERNRFYIRWPRKDANVSVCAGHMLNNLRAPALIRSLAEISLDGVASVQGFQWGSATQLPFLPRIQIGRIVLALAQWRITAEILSSPGDWRTRWKVPRHVYLVESDNRLLLDLEDPSQFKELLGELKRQPALILQEVFPSLEQAWLSGPGGRYFSEFVVPLIRRRRSVASQVSGKSSAHSRTGQPNSTPVSSQDRLRPPGSDWLFAKLYGDAQTEETLVSGELASFASSVISSGAAKSWHFIRYNDPDPHIRLRFQGKPDALVRAVWPQLCAWAEGLINRGLCRRFAVDTYERELERYGGASGLVEAETIFATDSRAVAQMLKILKNGALEIDRISLATISIDSLLSSLGIPENEKIAWCRESGISKSSGGIEYRSRQKTLIEAVHSLAVGAKGTPLEALENIFSARNAEMAASVARLYALEKAGKLSNGVRSICHSLIHLHCNRLLGADTVAEQTAISLVVRLRLSFGAGGFDGRG